MKKTLLILSIILLCGCSSIKENKENKVIQNNKVEIVESPEEKYIDKNQVKLSLFLYDNNYNNKVRIEDTYYTNFISGTDIGSFEVFLTDDKIINGTNFKQTWNTYFNKYEKSSVK